MVTIDAVNEVALRAGEVVLRHYRANDTWVKKKADGSPVTGVDLEAEEIIRDGLLRLDASMPYVSEERELPAYDVRRAWPRYWLVDPLDGTKEFISRNGEFTVNIALVINGSPVLGVVHAPAIGRTFYGAEDEGAFCLEGDEARVITARPPPTDGVVVVTSRSHGAGEELDAFLGNLNVASTSPAGSSLKFCLVAAGEADVYPRFGRTMEWDTAAGQAVLMAAGGRVETAAGDPLLYGKEGVENPHFIAYGATNS